MTTTLAVVAVTLNQTEPAFDVVRGTLTWIADCKESGQGCWEFEHEDDLAAFEWDPKDTGGGDGAMQAAYDRAFAYTARHGSRRFTEAEATDNSSWDTFWVERHQEV